MALRAELLCRTAVLGGEIACFDDQGGPDLLALLYRRGIPSFVAFNVLAPCVRSTERNLCCDENRKIEWKLRHADGRASVRGYLRTEDVQ